MVFASIVTIFFLGIGSPFPSQAVSLELHRSSSVELHRTARAEPEYECPGGVFGGRWLKHYNNCYYFSSTMTSTTPAPKLTWPDAKKHCQNLLRGEENVFLAELGIPGNAESDIWLMEMIVEKSYPVWLGAQDFYGNNTWIWQHSQRQLSLRYPLWGPNQPNNHRGVMQNCLSTLLKGGRNTTRQYLNDEICEEEYLDYVCQYPLPISTTE